MFWWLILLGAKAIADPARRKLVAKNFMFDNLFCLLYIFIFGSCFCRREVKFMSNCFVCRQNAMDDGNWMMMVRDDRWMMCVMVGGVWSKAFDLMAYCCCVCRLSTFLIG